jgi:hypothetical protein
MLILATLGGLVLPSTLAQAAPFQSGNVVVYRVGDGVAGLVNTGVPVFLDEYTPGGTLVQSLPLPTSVSGASKQLIASGTATSEGLLSRSADGTKLLLSGYATNLGGAVSLSGTSGASVPRTVGVADALGNIDTSRALTDFSSGNNPRSVASSDGVAVWVAGGTGGVRYSASPSDTTSLDLTSSGGFGNVRQLQVLGGQLYASSGSGTNTFRGVETVGIGLPTTAGQTVTRLPGLTDTTNPSTYGFFLADLDPGVAGFDTLYVADDAAGALQKFSLVAGSWVSNGKIGVDADDYRGLAATVSGTSVTLFATRKGGSAAAGGGELVTLTDASGYNGAFAGTPTVLATAALNTAFRGVAFAPEGAAPTPTPTAEPTPTPTEVPTPTPTEVPTPTPTEVPTPTPTEVPTPTPTEVPTPTPTEVPTPTPTEVPTPTPTEVPTPTPTEVPTPTPTEVPTPTPTSAVAECAPAPISGCAVSAKGTVRISNTGDPKKGKLVFQWIKGTATTSQFGDPVTGDTSYAVCVYGDGALLIDPLVTADGLWKTVKPGFRYRNKNANADGIAAFDLAQGTGKAKIAVTARGTKLVVPAVPLPATGEVKVQIVKNPAAGSECWEATFAAPFKRNKAPTFNDVLP